MIKLCYDCAYFIGFACAHRDRRRCEGNKKRPLFLKRITSIEKISQRLRGYVQ
jgi:hypothetical protein